MPQLHGFYSIKKVLPEIRKMRPDLFDKSGSVDYKSDLQIHNGSEAQILSTKRFFGKISNDE
ncbi:hypothetical protein FACS1894152_6310 [Bacilli bacterium]|nr:hypothetical protein FACS1894152_6310 [Bacilli bacterium]